MNNNKKKMTKLKHIRENYCCLAYKTLVGPHLVHFNQTVSYLKVEDGYQIIVFELKDMP